MNSIRLLAGIGDKVLIKLLFSPWNNNRMYLGIGTSLTFLMSWLIEQQPEGKEDASLCFSCVYTCRVGCGLVTFCLKGCFHKLEIISLFSAFHVVQYLLISSWKRVALICEPSDKCALIPQPNSLHEKLGWEVCFLLQLYLFVCISWIANT